MKVYKYRLYPSKRQKTLLRNTLEACRKTYNMCLEYKRDAWEDRKENVSEFDMNNQITQWRKENEWMRDAGIANLHDVSRRVKNSFGGFYRRVRFGQKAGYPRFKGKFRYDSFSNPRFALRMKDGKIRLSNKLGWVKIKMHRPVEGEVKGYTIRRNSCGEWFISITVENVEYSKPPIQKPRSVGLDMGCPHFLTTSGGKKVENPKFFKKDAEDLAKVQRRKDRRATAKIHKRIANRRNNFHHQLSREIIDNYDAVYVEDLNVAKMSTDTWKSVRKSMLDAGWAQFMTFLSYKAEEAGKIFEKVNPAYTSQRCSSCGETQELDLSDRVYQCACGHTDDRDINAAKNILALGQRNMYLECGATHSAKSA